MKKPDKEHSNTDQVDIDQKKAVSEKEQSRKDWEIIKKLVPNIWPKNDWGTKTRVVLAVSLLVGGKVSFLSCWSVGEMKVARD